MERKAWSRGETGAVVPTKHPLHARRCCPNLDYRSHFILTMVLWARFVIIPDKEIETQRLAKTPVGAKSPDWTQFLHHRAGERRTVRDQSN